MFLHFSVTEKVTTNTEKIDIFASEAMVNTKPGTFSSMVCIFALSNVIECQINSVYSLRNSKLFPLYTRVVGSKTVKEN